MNIQKGSRQTFKVCWNRIFSLDSRSLFLAQRLFAIVLGYDLFIRFKELQFLSPELGFFPAPYFSSFYARFPDALSFFRYSDSVSTFTFFFFLAFTAVVMVFANKWARGAYVFLWFFFTSLKFHAHMRGKGFDVLTLAMLLWFIVMPELKMKWKNVKSAQKQFLDFSTIGFIVQVATLYFFTFLYKTGSSEWTKDFSALFYILQKAKFSTILSQQLVAFPAFLKGLTAATMVVEGVVPLLVLFLFSRPLWRTRICLFYILFHLSILFYLHVGLFSPLSIVLWIALMPGAFWDWIFKLPETAGNIEEGFHSFRSSLALILMSVVVLANMAYFKGPVINSQHTSLNAVELMSLNQQWSMFGEFETKPFDLWIVSEAKLNGQTRPYDVLNKRPYTIAPPLSSDEVVPNYQWRNVLYNIPRAYYMENKVDLAYHLANYLCLTNKNAEWVKIHLMNRNVDTKSVRSIPLTEQRCFNKK